MNTKAASERYQRQVQELSKQPENATCADCRGRYPRWASWNLGIFLCVNCAGVHRKMGTHISKVKSLTLDTWTKEQVERMRVMGNAKNNAKYNPDERRNRPPANVEEGERNSELERYIFDKYKGRFMDSRPPPVPMKDVPRLSPNPTGNGAVAAAVDMPSRSANRSVTAPVPASWSDAQSAVAPSNGGRVQTNAATTAAAAAAVAPAPSSSLAPPQANVPPRSSSATLQLSRGPSSSGVQTAEGAATTPSVFDDLLSLQNGPSSSGTSLAPPLQMVMQPNQQMNPWAHLATQQQAVVSPMVMSHTSPFFQSQQDFTGQQSMMHAQGATLGAMAFAPQSPHNAFHPSPYPPSMPQMQPHSAFAPQMMGQQAFGGGGNPGMLSPSFAQPSYFGGTSPMQQQALSGTQRQVVPSPASNNPFGNFANSMMPTGQQQQRQM